MMGYTCSFRGFLAVPCKTPEIFGKTRQPDFSEYMPITFRIPVVWRPQTLPHPASEAAIPLVFPNTYHTHKQLSSALIFTTFAS